MRLIDADALMDDIKRDSKKAIDDGDKVGSFWLGYIAGLVIKQPTIQPEVLACGNGELVATPEPQWIPVSERLPETEEFVLASLTGKYRNITFEHACEIADYADGEWCVYAYPHMSAEKCEELIEAWMPLPEPYTK